MVRKSASTTKKKVKKRKLTPEELYAKMQLEKQKFKPMPPELGVDTVKIKEIKEEPLEIKTKMPLPKSIPRTLDLDKIVLEIDNRRARKIKDWKSWYIGFADGIFLIRHILDSTKED